MSRTVEPRKGAAGDLFGRSLGSMSQTPAGWYPDPTEQHTLRYWDGTQWTEHGHSYDTPPSPETHGVSSPEIPTVGAPNAHQTPPNQAVPATPPVGDIFDRVGAEIDLGATSDPNKIHNQVFGDARFSSAKVDGLAFQGDGTVFNTPVLVVNQKAKVFEITNQYSVFDHNGTQIAAVNQVGQSTAKKVMRLMSNLDQLFTHKLEIVDHTGSVLLRLTRPAKIMKSTIIVSDAHDQEIGRIVQENMMGKIRFGLIVGGETVGRIKAQNWRAWNFQVEDANGQEIATITKTFEGIAKAVFTTADNYVVHIHQQIPQPLNSLVVAAALSVDTALKQDD